MNARLCPLPLALDRPARSIAIFVRTASVAIFLGLFFFAVGAHAADKKVPADCGFSDAQFDPATDVHAVDEYGDAVAELLKQEKFSELDCMANAARAGKTRFSGSYWKLAGFYVGLESPRPGHPTQDDWKKHIQLVERWAHENSHSITARVALAESYINYAWDARGDGSADSVSDSGWKLFGERIAKAKEILDEASTLKDKCPEWYYAMEWVAQGQSWDLPRIKALLDEAVAFAPDYQYSYRFYAYLLLPKWFGEDGDGECFAEEAANKIGGDAGDILYFQIGTRLLCGCKDESEFAHFSWPRLQKGFNALQTKYGSSLNNDNKYALMAIRSNGWVEAESAFQRIGDNWDKDVWTNHDWFQQNRDTAAQLGPVQARARAFRQVAEVNVKTPAGKAYLADFNPKFVPFEQSCLSDASGAPKSEVLIQVGASGSVEETHTEKPPDAFAQCVMKALYVSYLKKETPFPPPPAASYKLILEIDPASLSAAK
jgi:hypothetical protein